MCSLNERSELKVTPRLRAEVDEVRVVPWKLIVDEVTLDRCCGVPIRRYSVLDGLTVSRFIVSQACTLSRVEERIDKLRLESEAAKEM